MGLNKYCEQVKLTEEVWPSFLLCFIPVIYLIFTYCHILNISYCSELSFIAFLFHRLHSSEFYPFPYVIPFFSPTFSLSSFSFLSFSLPASLLPLAPAFLPSLVASLSPVPSISPFPHKAVFHRSPCSLE